MLDEFRAQFRPVFTKPRPLADRIYRVWEDLELVSDSLAGSLYSNFREEQSDDVFRDRARFLTVQDPEGFLTMVPVSTRGVPQGALAVQPANEEERASQGKLLGSAAGMERLSRLAHRVLTETRSRSGGHL